MGWCPCTDPKLRRQASDSLRTNLVLFVALPSQLFVVLLLDFLDSYRNFGAPRTQPTTSPIAKSVPRPRAGPIRPSIRWSAQAYVSSNISTSPTNLA